MSLLAALRPERVLDDLRALAELTGDENGAQRLCWTPTWARARKWLEERLQELPGRPRAERDEAGNLWVTLPGAASETVLLGSHLDSVPDGGRLDGALGVLAGLEVLRAAAAAAQPSHRTLALVDWADEEGARFGRSLFGSSAATGLLAPGEVGDLRDAEGLRLEDVLAHSGVDLANASHARRRLDGVVAALELHIEQGPVLEDAGVPLGIPTGTLGVERRRLVLRGAASHAGSTPMALRRDPLAAAAGAILAAREAALAAGSDARATVGRIEAHPNIPTAVPAEAALTLDIRAPTAGELATLVAAVESSVASICGRERVEAVWEPLWSIAPIPFDAELMQLAEDVAAAPTLRLPSGALHDAANLAAVGIHTAMIFVRSRDGISHSPLEDSSDEDIVAGVRALAAATDRLLHAA